MTTKVQSQDWKALSERVTKLPWQRVERSGYHEILAYDETCDWYGVKNRHAVAYVDTEIDEGEAVGDLITFAVNNFTQLLTERDEAVANLKQAMALAYQQGALDVHQHWDSDTHPDFTEAGRDYVRATLSRTQEKGE